MNQMIPRILSILTLFVWIHTTSQAKQWNAVSASQPAKSKPVVIQSNVTSSTVQFSLNGYFLEEVNTSKGVAYTLNSPGGSSMLKEGAPDLPLFSISLVIPDHGQMEVIVLNSKFTDYPNVMIAPSKGNVYRNIDISDVPYRYGKEYQNNAFYPSAIVDTRLPHIFRDYRGQTFLFQPFNIIL
ncbi:MAG: hypothetical protein IPK10_01315 [Bacteroidetes bacterium]|nr:hypothetical protein [Bacteroidota bacterium]